MIYCWFLVFVYLDNFDVYNYFVKNNNIIRNFYLWEK